MESVHGKRILITGATGLLGQALVKKALQEKMYVVASVRSIKKARKLFDRVGGIEFIESDIQNLPLDNKNIDYVIHAAANTSSAAFINDPVGVISTNILGTLRTLEFSRINNVTKYIYLSTMEVYGYPDTDELIGEDHSTNLNTMNVRSSYPESKRACELLCRSYMSQYNLPINVVRLTQTIGPGIKYEDNRVFAQFARSAAEGKDIVLHTKGETKRSYLYIDDAVSAIFTVLEKGKPGEAYNAANENTYCSIYEMAHIVSDKCAQGTIKVVVKEDNCDYGYTPTLKLNLDTKKLRDLGWEPSGDLESAFDKLIEYMKEVLNAKSQNE